MCIIYLHLIETCLKVTISTFYFCHLENHFWFHLCIFLKKKNICTSSTFLYFSRFLPPYSTLTGSQNIHKPLILPCSIPQYFCAFLFLRAIFSAFCTKTIFPTSAIQPIQAVSSDKGVRKPCKEWHCFNLFLLPQSIGSDNRAHNHWLFIAQD